MAAAKFMTLLLALLFIAMPIGANRVMQGPTRRLTQYYNYNPRQPQTCENFPAICDNPGSAGKDCCRRQCVDLKSDMFNCGECGKWCNYGQVCCNGQCLNVLFNNKNCGGCGNKCDSGGRCVYGMCNYA
ncbi:Stigma-specific Stig1 family protein [Zostera marina]|uniref:Stigma-specific Stig1 family protein n=1 Tax=Zostera marina TaxID=29655 RepID=A0A0K9PC11_ZOSMR|nr:Stigma-specific Stig1 family protein [Zostera marina]